jgi:hypothetical protein
VAKKGTICPIFEGDMPPRKCTPNIGANIGAITGILLNTPRRCAIPRDSPKFFKILRIEIKNYPILMTMGMY